MTPAAKAHWQIHLCVLLWGFTAILGKLITLPALPLVWWRMGLVVLALLLVPRVWRGLRAMPGRLLLAYAGVGVLVALHWLTFYGAIKLANASVAATCMAFATVFTALIEPKLAGRRFSRREVALGLAVLPGVALVVGGVSADMRVGIAVGALSALFVAVFGSLNKRLVEHADPLTVTAVELGAVCLGWGGELALAGRRVAVTHGPHVTIETRNVSLEAPDSDAGSVGVQMRADADGWVRVPVVTAATHRRRHPTPAPRTAPRSFSSTPLPSTVTRI